MMLGFMPCERVTANAHERHGDDFLHQLAGEFVDGAIDHTAALVGRNDAHAGGE
jgi:hypothetical protein